MVSNIVKYAGVVALAILLFVGGSKLLTVNNVNFGTAVDCQSVTCFTTVGVLTSFQDDGTAIFNGAVTMASTFVPQSLKVGTNGTTMTRINTGQCYILAYATTIAASSTATVDCQGTALIYNTNVSRATALTGVTAGDNVVLTLATSSASSVFGGIVVESASASTTPGYISLTIANLTGATFTWPTSGAATGTASYIATK